jgi:hybrid cluster-associated redox disulfide protein
MTITKEMIIQDILTTDVDLAQILLKSGMRCLGCPSARSESLADACAVHGADADALVKEMNEYLAAKD